MGFIIAAIVAGVASGVGQGASAGLRAKAARRAAERRARMLRYEANDKDILAFRARVRGAAMAGMKASEIAPLRGTVRANVAAGNVDVSSSSARAIENQAARYKRLDSMSIRFNAERHARDLDRASGRLRFEASQTIEQGEEVARATAIAGGVAAVASAVGTGLQTYLAANRPEGSQPPSASGGSDRAGGLSGPGPSLASEGIYDPLTELIENWGSAFDPIVR